MTLPNLMRSLSRLAEITRLFLSRQCLTHHSQPTADQHSLMEALHCNKDLSMAQAEDGKVSNRLINASTLHHQQSNNLNILNKTMVQHHSTSSHHRNSRIKHHQGHLLIRQTLLPMTCMPDHRGPMSTPDVLNPWHLIHEWERHQGPLGEQAYRMN
jgi:hypothetical protein